MSKGLRYQNNQQKTQKRQAGQKNLTRLQSSQRKRRRKIVRTTGFFAIIIAVLIIGGWQARRLFPYPEIFARLGIENWQVWAFHDYFGISPQTLTIVMDGERVTGTLENPPFLTGSSNSEIYFPVEFLREFIDPFVFWDESARSTFISTDTEVFRFQGETALPLDFLQDKYSHVLLDFQPEYNVLVIANLENPDIWRTASTRRTAVRYRPDNTAFIAAYIPANSPLTAFNFAAASDFTRIRTASGLLGYVATEDLSAAEPIFTAPQEIPHYSPRINLAWEMITVMQANYVVMQNPLPLGLDVISPTWFNFDPNEPNGTLISFASQDYVDWAHNSGVQVWAKVFDTNHDISQTILTNYQARAHVIEQLLGFVDTYNLDGLNIDFEHLRTAVGRYYLQFLREIAPPMRERGAVLSVATFVPAPWFSHYYHELVGRTVDFVAIMAYDEHYGGSPEPGPVASLPFVERFMSQTAALIPPHKVLMGLPFYNRVWRVRADGSHTIANYGMNFPQQLIAEWGVLPVWDDIIGSYFVEFSTTEDDEPITYKLWLEDERSIAAKLNIFERLNLGGVAGWRRGLETPGVWTEIYRVLR
ncbi:MAG: glycosyl hydrolase family 18 protein [Defluviitaleaceae bacterium]|nr:glycosyl hydrolase family 18 protein [Defluviitaleaceae bacterium]